MDNEIRCIERHDFHKHTLLTRLLTLHDIPEKIFYRGKLPEITFDEYGRANPRILTVVGSRKYTEYGKHVTEKLISSLTRKNILILSGLAYGIDSISHKTALTSSLLTIAVPGSGIDDCSIYPSSHVNLAHEITENGGAVISELEPETKAAKWTFPARNRIMSALSDAVLIIEAEEKSGTLITARQSLELGKDIGAVPGNIFSPSSKGTNSLIQEGACSITSIEDLLDLLHLPRDEKAREETTTHLSKDEQTILNLLTETREKDNLMISSGLSFDRFITAFSSLEINDYIEETFGEVRRLV